MVDVGVVANTARSFLLSCFLSFLLSCFLSSLLFLYSLYFLYSLTLLLSFHSLVREKRIKIRAGGGWNGYGRVVVVVRVRRWRRRQWAATAVGGREGVRRARDGDGDGDGWG